MFSTILNGLKLPIKLLVGLVRKKPKRTELEQKCWKHVRNFAPGRLKNVSWQVRSGKKLTKKQREYYKNRKKKTQKP